MGLIGIGLAVYYIPVTEDTKVKASLGIELVGADILIETDFQGGPTKGGPIYTKEIAVKGYLSNSSDTYFKSVIVSMEWSCTSNGKPVPPPAGLPRELELGAINPHESRAIMSYVGTFDTRSGWLSCVFTIKSLK